MLRHGTRNGYTNHRCRCNPCREANRDYMRDMRRRQSDMAIHRLGSGHSASQPIPRDALLAPCWCEHAYSYVSPIDVARGRTWSCGRANCEPPTEGG